jgi:pilus assembly protein CpaE
VLDLPHAWEPWIRAALCEADEVVIVAGSDLASLRNADNMLKLLRSERDQASAPKIVLSMTGLPKRPEIPLKDYAQALCVQPAMLLGFEPELFAAAEANARMIYEAMPDAKAALQLDALASMLTGYEPVARPELRLAKGPSAEPVLELVTLAPPETAPRRTRSGRKQRVARTGFVALQAPLPEKRRSTGFVRMLAAMAALTALGVWFVEHRGAEAAPDAAMAFRA